jgi:hypothetical protein
MVMRQDVIIRVALIRRTGERSNSHEAFFPEFKAVGVDLSCCSVICDKGLSIETHRVWQLFCLRRALVSLKTQKRSQWLRPLVSCSCEKDFSELADTCAVLLDESAPTMLQKSLSLLGPIFNNRDGILTEDQDLFAHFSRFTMTGTRCQRQARELKQAKDQEIPGL